MENSTRFFLMDTFLANIISWAIFEFFQEKTLFTDYHSGKNCSDSEKVETKNYTVVGHSEPVDESCKCNAKLVHCDCDIDQSQSTNKFPSFKALLLSFEEYIEQPCEKTKMPLMQLLEDRKNSYDKLFPPEKIDYFCDSIRTFLNHKYSQDMHNKNEKSSKICESAKQENRNFVNLGSQPSSISDKDSSTEEESDSNEMNFVSNKNQQQEEKQQYYTKQHNDKKKKKDNLILPSQKPVRKQSLVQNSSTSIQSRYPSISNGASNDSQNSSSLIKTKHALNIQNPSVSIESKHASTSDGGSNDFQNPSASVNSKRLLTSSGASNYFQNPFASVNSKHPPTSNEASNDFQNPLTSTASKHASTLDGASSHFLNPQTSIENTDSAAVAATCEKFVENGLVLKERSNNDQPRKLEMVARKKDKSQLQGGQNNLEVQTYGYDIKAPRLTMQNSSKAELNSLQSGKPTEKCKDVLELWGYENHENHLRTLIDEICRLEKLIESLKIENQEILADFGQCIVEKAAKENEERRSKFLLSIICSKAQPADVSVDNSTGDTKDFRLGYPKESLANKIGNPEVDASVVITLPDGEQPVQGAEALVPASNDRKQRKEVGAQGSSSFASEERASGGEGNNESENVEGSSVLASASEEGIHLSFSVQQDYSNETEYISLGHIPLQSVAKLLYTNYKLLLVSQSQLLLSSDIMKLKDWAARNFSIENTQNATDVLFKLDKKGVINASDLSPLRNFFESIVRFDLVYIIDEFLLGDYTLLHKISVMKKRDATKALQNPQHASRYTRALSSLRQTSLQGSTPARNAGSSGSLRMITDENPATSRKPGNSNGTQSSLPQPRHQPLFPNNSTLSNANNPNPPSVIPNENQSSIQQQNLKSIASAGFTEQSVVVVNSPIANERRTTAANSSTRKNASVTNSARNTQKFGNDSSKLSKFQPPESSIVSHSHHHGASGNPDLELESNWLCSHYKRHCYVKFECCDKFWPCHRCHNNQSTCGQKKLKSRDTQMVKCVYCKKVQPFGQFCCNCAAKFSSYFCGMCKHLTGNDDHPYHCDKCGICRIHGDRSFHCDVCGVCLDVQLRGNHKCREGSAHDECCICLEDAFTGCQILPCSHKVHKECATQMIRSGITRCPICRESFAHKLERRPLQNSRKRSGK